MSWLRLDDGFTKHPKFEGWTIKDRWAWLEVMEYCARYRTRGRIPTDLDLLPRTVTRQILTKAETAGWATRGDDNALWINDWELYNPPDLAPEELDERIVAALTAKPDASANEVVRMVGGRRRDVLEALKKHRPTGSPTGSHGSQNGEQGGSGNQAGTGSRAGTRARTRPVPTTKLQRSSGDQPLSSNPPPDSATAPPAAHAPTRPAIDVALDRIRNIGAELPPNDLHADITDALGPRAQELDDDDWILLRDLHADLTETTTLSAGSVFAVELPTPVKTQPGGSA